MKEYIEKLRMILAEARGQLYSLRCSYKPEQQGYKETTTIINRINSILETAQQAPVESEESVQANCRDCNLPYSEFGVDVVLPNTQWEDIFPEKDGLLCGTCIAKRADKLKGILYISAVLVNNTKSS